MWLSLAVSAAPLFVIIGQVPGADAPFPAPAGVRCDYFVVDTELPGGDRGPAALIEISETPSPHGPIREREVRFREGPIHLREVETCGPARPQSIWRERGATWGRSWLAIWDEELGALETTHWGPAREIHGLRAFPERPLMGLELIELCRRTWLDGEGFDCLDPLAGGVAFLEIHMRDVAPGQIGALFDRLVIERPAGLSEEGPPSRLVEWRRCDGSLAGRFLFQDGELQGFQWQEGASWARRVERRVYAEARASWFADLPDRTGILEDSLERLRQRSLQGVASDARSASARIR